jgi:hypothetical protein
MTVSEPETDRGVPAAGSAPVADALADLTTLAERDLAEHPDVFERVHGQLQSALSSIDDA